VTLAELVLSLTVANLALWVACLHARVRTLEQNRGNAQPQPTESLVLNKPVRTMWSPR
jgi:hypothetical protein